MEPCRRLVSDQHLEPGRQSGCHYSVYTNSDRHPRRNSYLVDQCDGQLTESPPDSTDSEGTLTAIDCGVVAIHFDLDFHSPRTAPVGSWMKLNQPMPVTSVTSFMTLPPNDFAFWVAA